MITTQDLERMWREYTAASNAYLIACQQHADRLIPYNVVKLAHGRMETSKAAYDRAAFEYQQQAMNAKPAGGRQRA